MRAVAGSVPDVKQLLLGSESVAQLATFPPTSTTYIGEDLVVCKKVMLCFDYVNPL